MPHLLGSRAEGAATSCVELPDPAAAAADSAAAAACRALTTGATAPVLAPAPLDRADVLGPAAPPLPGSGRSGPPDTPAAKLACGLERSNGAATTPT